MGSEILEGLALVLGGGVVAQWLAARLRVPSILVLLGCGLLLGPGLGWLDPDRLLGSLLFPGVSAAVAWILFEGGLGLRLRDLARIGPVLRNLATTGLLVSWVLAAGAARLTLGLGAESCWLLGAILVVTGPTVILPLLRQVRLRAPVGTILRWEGIGNDPIGAVLATLVYEAVMHRRLAEAPHQIFLAVLGTLVVGTLAGWLAGRLLVEALARRWVPEELQASLTVAAVLGTYVGAGRLTGEAGLVAVTVLGVALANQERVGVAHLVRFGEEVGGLLLAGLFLLLSARVPAVLLAELDAGALAFGALLILVVRPLSVAVATWRTELSWRERTFLALMAPRGVVAVAVTSVFALELAGHGHPDAARLVPVMVLVVLVTVGVYGLAASPLARLLGLAEEAPRGALVLGANELGRALAQALDGVGVPVLMVDAGQRRLGRARGLLLPTQQVNLLAGDGARRLPLEGLGCLLAVSENDEVNALAALRFEEHFGRARVFVLGPQEGGEGPGRTLFGAGLDYPGLRARLREGAEIVALPVLERAPLRGLLAPLGAGAIPLFLVGAGPLQVFTSGDPPGLAGGVLLLALRPARV